MEKARNVRRAAKGSLTRAIRSVNEFIEAERPWEEVQQSLANVIKAFTSLEEKHEEYTLLLNDEEFIEAEEWMDACVREYNQINIKSNDCIKYQKEKEHTKNNVEVNNDNDDENDGLNEANNDGGNGNVNLNVHDVNDQNANANANANENVNNANASVNGNVNDVANVNGNDNVNGNVNNANANVNGNVNNVNANVNGNVNVNASVEGIVDNVNASAYGSANANNVNGNPSPAKEEKPIISASLKHEKPKLPAFNGDVRKYFIFKDDFKHAVESRCLERDTITILRTCLGTEPAKLIEGISNDLKTIWKYLDQTYGDPRIVSDVITSDLEKFKPIQPGEDHRFCELVNLVRRSYNILKEIKRPQDIDNTHVISLIERKMSKEDQRVWSRNLNQQKKEPSMCVLLEWLDEEMAARMRSSATIRKSNSHPTRSSTVNAVTTRETQNAAGHQLTTNASQREKAQCYVCQGRHYVDECPRFKEMSVKERWRVVKDKHACFCCLKYSKDHSASNCRKKRECGESTLDSKCKKFHHKLLHANEIPKAGVSSVQDNSTTLLPITTGIIKGRRGLKKEVNVFFDSGAQISMIRSELAESLELEGKQTTIYITKVGGTEEELNTKVYKVPIYTRNKTAIQSIYAVGIKQISDETNMMNTDSIAQKLDVPLNDVRRKEGPIDILIGINYPGFHAGETKEKDGLVARHSPLGWVVFGYNSSKSTNQHSQVLHVRPASPVDLTDFWKTETMGVAAQPCTCKPSELTTEERMELDVIKKSCKLDKNRWLMNYPWKRDAHLLPNNYSQVLKKLENTEQRLMKQPDYAESYNKQVHEMHEMGFSRKLTDKELKTYNGPIYYIAHHAVVRPEKKSTPIRIVFNSSASFQGHTLNDYWYKGPDMLNSLFGVILRFRENSVAICGDISKMYHMITIPVYDQHVHRFIWRDLETERKPDTYVKTVLTFGDRPAPAMATVALRKTAELNQEKHPRAAEAVIKNAYMDDICDSVNSASEAKDLAQSIDEILASGGFKVKEWIFSTSNEDHQNEEVTIGDENESEKVLGVVWNPNEDSLTYKVKIDETVIQELMSKPLTKRKILSKVAGIFDPIGASAAVLIKAKIALQGLWQLGLGWDDEVPPEIKNQWNHLFKELFQLNDFKFERCIKPPNTVDDPMLIIFCDASRLAFGACAYIRWKIADGKYEVKFVVAKSRVSPLKELSIPRLELQAAVLASRLTKSIQEQSRFNFTRIVHFTDSLVVLAWIQGQSRCYRPFVSCRIGEIHHNSEPSDWFYCPTQWNVADDLSKGIPVKDLHGRWMSGPAFLQKTESEWPNQQSSPDMNEVNKERRKTTLVQAVTVKEPVLKCEDFSSWKRLLRVTAYVKRFIYNCRKSDQTERDLGPLQPEEIIQAEEYWVKTAQSSLHQRLEKGDLASLTPFLDENGIIKVGGRVDPSLMSYDNSHATLLPYGHWISTLITREAHQYGHAGIATTTAKVRKKFWIIKGNSISKRVKRQCTFCRKLEAKVSPQFMADLPLCRQQPFTPPFLYTSCDYFGPCKVKIGRNKTTKHYGVIFTCLNTRAVHCELATELSTMELLQVLRRFFAVRGYPKLMISDNGTQMVGTERELREMIEGWDKTKLKEYCTDRGMKWQFTTPLAPHQNGCAESMVKSIKRALKKAIGDQVLSPFELYTCMLEAANLVNQRPIGRIPNDPDEGSYLCPNDILLGRCSSRIPQGPFRKTNNPRHRYEFCQKIVDTFWKRWSRDVLPSLVMRRKWQERRPNAAVGDYVTFLKDDNDIRGKWCIGRITDVFPGRDGVVRNVKVKSSESTYRRPIQKICVIHPNEGFE